MQDVPLAVRPAWLSSFVSAAVPALAEETGLPFPKTVEVSVIAVSAARIRALSARHLGKDRVTDVLSFPLAEPGTVEPHLGDIVICPRSAERNAAAAARSYRTEVALLLLHGLLHLLGYDHERDDGEMRVLEQRLRRRLKLRRLGDEERL